MPVFESPAPVAVLLDLAVANIRIAASDRHDTGIEVRPSDPDNEGDRKAAEETTVDFTSGRLQVRTPKTWRPSLHSSRRSIDVVVEVPAGSSVSGEAGVANLVAVGRLAQLTFKSGVGELRFDEVDQLSVRTGAGDITAGKVAGSADIKTGSGRIDVDDLAGHAVVRNSNGETHIVHASGELEIRAANGRIIVDRADSALSAKAANGDIRVGTVAGGQAVLESAMGSIDVGVRDGVSAWLDVETRFGHVTSDLDATEAPAAGAETAEIKARTAMGNITIRRVSQP